ncbi:hypothetical protein GGI42DRAFT_320114 [Trichoderma sp. SZMC 28013]
MRSVVPLASVAYILIQVCSCRQVESGSDFRKLRQGCNGRVPFDLQRSKRLLYHYLRSSVLACSGTPCPESGPV